MTDWNIQSRARGCEACGKPFADHEAYHTLLFDEKSDLRRSDICGICWEKQYSEARDRKGFISCWRGIYELPAPPTEAIKGETAESLLRKLIQRNDPHHIPAGFILAVMLERKRVLKVKEQLVRDGRRVFVYEQPKTGDVFAITDPDLKLDQLEQVQRDVANLLEHGLTPPPAPTPDAGALASPPEAEPVPVVPEAQPSQPETASKAD